MKAIRSLEQHVDSLMSYDFTDLTDDMLLEELEIVDDMRIWRIAEAIRRSMEPELIHDITKIDRWFIDKLSILVEMEMELKTHKLYAGPADRGKAAGISGSCNTCETDGKNGG